MEIRIRKFENRDDQAAVAIWNQVVEDGVAFPQTEPLTEESGFFQVQSYTGVAYDKDTEEIIGLYILHPNNVGRCGHICNASYAVKKELRGQHIGEALVTHCLEQAKALGFRILQFNAVVKSNATAIALYKKLGFVELGTIPNGFHIAENRYEDIVLYYYVL